MFHKHCLDGNLIPVRVDAHTKHVSDHRLHSKSREVRKSFAKEINQKIEDINEKFSLLIKDDKIVRNGTNYSSGSSGTPESLSEIEDGYW